MSEGERLVVPGAAISGGTSAPAEEREPVERAPSVEQRMAMARLVEQQSKAEVDRRFMSRARESAPYLATGWVIGVGLWMLRGRRS